MIFIIDSSVYTQNKSYFFTNEQSNAIIDKLNNKNKTNKKKVQDYKLSGICYLSIDNWVVWINGQSYNKIGQYSQFSIDAVTSDTVTITTIDCKTIHLTVKCDNACIVPEITENSNNVDNIANEIDINNNIQSNVENDTESTNNNNITNDVQNNINNINNNMVLNSIESNFESANNNDYTINNISDNIINNNIENTNKITNNIENDSENTNNCENTNNNTNIINNNT